ncbi:hypothetical protein L2E82_38420 [Cichorium intybus]|uniref:Uncharacterized protein n=1 Tax=Cichorium intybus TaxID=13427 RepID=A0ACB9AGB5_CICIN|nr:hypothetical protein L2E82_38420 [Cichorium intybus]
MGVTCHVQMAGKHGTLWSQWNAGVVDTYGAHDINIQIKIRLPVSLSYACRRVCYKRCTWPNHHPPRHLPTPFLNLPFYRHQPPSNQFLLFPLSLSPPTILGFLLFIHVLEQTPRSLIDYGFHFHPRSRRVNTAAAEFR